MIDSAMAQYRKSFAENLWEKCIINEEFDHIGLCKYLHWGHAHIYIERQRPNTCKISLFDVHIYIGV